MYATAKESGSTCTDESSANVTFPLRGRVQKGLAAAEGGVGRGRVAPQAEGEEEAEEEAEE